MTTPPAKLRSRIIHEGLDRAPHRAFLRAVGIVARRLGAGVMHSRSIEFAKKSLAFIRQAPLIGHGTGSIHAQFTKAAEGHTGTEGVASANPLTEGSSSTSRMV